jgi:hypothetical protein
VATEFLYSHIVCRFNCPLELITNQGSQFVNRVVIKSLKQMSVKHRKTVTYYPQANNLVEKTNTTPCNILDKVVLGKRKAWNEHLNEALWANRTAFKVTTGFTPFHLAFKTEAVIPIELEIPTLRTVIEHGLNREGALEACLLQSNELDEHL